MSSTLRCLSILVLYCCYVESFLPARMIKSFLPARMINDHYRTNTCRNCIPFEGVEVSDSAHAEISAAKTISQGVVLLAQPSEYNHFLIKAAVLIFDYGTGRGSRGVILERATAFEMGETSPNSGPFGENTLYLGGEDGSDKAIMFHKYDLEGFSKYIGAGIYTGGLAKARALVDNNEAVPKDFKFIFNSVEWGPDQLEAEVRAGRWDVANVPPDLILQQSTAKASLWSKVRNTLMSVGGLTGDDALEKCSDGTEVNEIDEKSS